MIVKEFGKKLKELRIEKNLSQKEFGNKIGATQSTIAKWESGDREPSFDILILISKFFKVSTDYLLGLEDF